MTILKHITILVFLSIYLLAFLGITYSQSVNVVLEHWAYEFLDRMLTRGFISSRMITFTRPYSRKDVAMMLAEIDTKMNSKGFLCTTFQCE